jgi:predicted nucleic acid-binding protein
VHAKQILLHPLNSIVLKKANHILGRCHPTGPLRTLDAIHAAACDLSQDFPLCTTDRRMRDAAPMLQIPVSPPIE